MPRSADTAPGSFKDYCLIMQLHPEADAAMVEAAYWHLARRYNEAALDDPSAKAKLDELNEAYHVLGSPDRREEYMRRRAAALGGNSLPAPPPSAKQPAPLPVMQRQYINAKPNAKPAREPEPLQPRPRLRLRLPQRPNWPRAGIPPWQNVATAAIIATLASTMLVSWASPGLRASLIATGLILTLVPLMRTLPRAPRLRRPSLLTRRRHSAPIQFPKRNRDQNSPEPQPVPLEPDALAVSHAQQEPSQGAAAAPQTIASIDRSQPAGS